MRKCGEAREVDVVSNTARNLALSGNQVRWERESSVSSDCEQLRSAALITTESEREREEREGETAR